MEDVDIDAMEIDTSVNSHNIECVASVSFDNQRKQFKYTGDHAKVFGKDQAAAMQAKQGGAVGAANRKFDEAARMNQNLSKN